MESPYRALTVKNRLLQWTEEMLNATSKTKESLGNANKLHHFVQDAPTLLTVDASDLAVGVFLSNSLVTCEYPWHCLVGN